MRRSPSRSVTNVAAVKFASVCLVVGSDSRSGNVHGVVTDRGSNPGGIGTGTHGS